MLGHSRVSTGVKALTDIYKLADENLPKINVIPQDIGRVLLSLINNAFQSPSPLTPDEGTKKVVVKTIAPPSEAGGLLFE